MIKTSRSPKSRGIRSRSRSSSPKSPINYEEYYTKLLNINHKAKLKKLNKKCLCSNNELVLTTELYEKNGNYIPLYYNSSWICFSFDEIFTDLYNLIKNEKLFYIPDPINYKENMSQPNVDIVMLIDNRFYGNKLTKLLKKNLENVENIIDIISEEGIYELLELYEVNKSDSNLAVNLFIHWYNDIDEESMLLKNSIYNFKVKSYDGKPINFGLLLDKYINNPMIDCSKDIKLALKNFLDYIYKENKKELEKIEEDEDEW
jgi:hypothetical protein